MTVLVANWLTTEDAAKELRMNPQSFRVWLHRHKEVHRRFVGRTCIVDMNSVREARGDMRTSKRL